MPPRRDEGANAGRRLSERISGFATETTVPAGAGLPPKPSPAALDSALSSGNGNVRRGTRNNGGQVGGPPPPPPPDAKEDPRAAAGKRVSYHDMDLVAEVRDSVSRKRPLLRIGTNDRETLSYSTNTAMKFDQSWSNLWVVGVYGISMTRVCYMF